MRLSALFEEFCRYLRVEREAAPRSIGTYQWCFGDFIEFAQARVGGTVLISHFTPDMCRAYQYDLSARGLKTNTIRVRLATLGSFGKWAVYRERIDKNPMDLLTRPRRKRRLPRVPRFTKVREFIENAADRRQKALLALMLYGALRRSEVVSLDVVDFVADFGLRRVKGKGDKEDAVPLPDAARRIVANYLSHDRKTARPGIRCSWFETRFRKASKCCCCGGESCEAGIGCARQSTENLHAGRTVTVDTCNVKGYTATKSWGTALSLGGWMMRSVVITSVIGMIIATASTLLAQAPASNTVHTPPLDLQDPAVIEAGARVFSQNCTHYCHAKEGRVARAPALRGRDLPIDYLYERITKGAPPMPAYGTVLSQDDLWRVIAYVHSLAAARD
jgi:mono/diheme cytochrome c family protein